MTHFRGSSDPYSGTTSIFDLPATEMFNYIIKNKLPKLCLPTYLHESNHHWLMSTDLFNAITVIELRANRSMLIDHNRDQYVMRDYAVSKLLTDLYRPFLEGFALFQEFDAIPGKSRLISTPSNTAGELFCDSDVEQQEGLSYPDIQRLLVDYRCSSVAFDRKVNAMLAPLESKTGYLSGYATVKRLWYLLQVKNNLMTDPEYFLCYMRAWLFQDWVAIETILNHTVSTQLTLEVIVERLLHRLESIVLDTEHINFSQFEEQSDCAEPDQAALLNSICINPADVSPGQDRLIEEIHTITQGISDEENQGIYLNDISIIKHRNELIRLSSEPVRVELKEFSRATVKRKRDELTTFCRVTVKREGDEVPYISAPFKDEGKIGETDGILSIYYQLERRQLKLFVSRPNQLMVTFPATEKLDEVGFTVAKISQTASAREKLRNDKNEMLKMDQAFLDTEKFLCSAKLRIYNPESLLDHDELPKETQEELKNGILSYLNNDTELVRGYINLSLLPGVSDPNDPLIDALWDCDYPPQEVIQKINAIQDNSAFKIAIHTDDGLYLSLL